jgi:hypothetical protein
MSTPPATALALVPLCRFGDMTHKDAMTKANSSYAGEDIAYRAPQEARLLWKLDFSISCGGTGETIGGNTQRETTPPQFLHLLSHPYPSGETDIGGAMHMPWISNYPCDVVASSISQQSTTHVGFANAGLHN